MASLSGTAVSEHPRVASASRSADGADFVVIDRLHGLKTLSDSLRREVDCLRKDVRDLKDSMNTVTSVYDVQENLWRNVRVLAVLVLPLLAVFMLDVCVLQVRALSFYREVMHTLTLGAGVISMGVIFPVFVVAWTTMDESCARMKDRLKRLAKYSERANQTSHPDHVTEEEAGDNQADSDLSDVDTNTDIDTVSDEIPNDNSELSSLDGRPQGGNGDGAVLENETEEEYIEDEEDEDTAEPEELGAQDLGADYNNNSNY